MDPITSRYYVSHHVKFNEHHFPFSSISSSSQNTSHSSTSNPWLSTLLYFHACSNLSSLPSLLGLVPDKPTGCSLNPPTPYNSYPPIGPTHIPPMGSSLPSILGPVSSHIPSPSHNPITPTSQNPSPHIASSSPEPATPILVSLTPQAISIPKPPHLSTSLAPVLPNISSHPMQTRSKSGISKKKSFDTTTNNYLQTEPHTYIIASKFLEW